MRDAHSVASDSLQPHGLYPTRLLLHGILQARILGGVPLSTPGDLPDPGTAPAPLASPALADRFFTWALPPRLWTSPSGPPSASLSLASIPYLSPLELPE